MNTYDGRVQNCSVTARSFRKEETKKEKKWMLRVHVGLEQLEQLELRFTDKQLDRHPE